ncbi:DUF3592 domain-containing protein [Flavihumibacter profundi]|uniref:DUF3592 domain-containing protein n=1 Tax=Flavihumibacter profundi TaxID=2716883 RepID=UPI001CC7C7F7|nr:hypothetical protein [Flavihumibacter profundi]MBZ5858575.1 hypothetical protein [Flavihumibacter profundi]
MKNIIAIVVVIGFASIWIIWGFWGKSKLNENHSSQTGIITKCTYGGKGNGGHILVEYNYELNGKKYIGTYSILSSKITQGDCEKAFVGKYFPLIYNPDNPANSRMLILPIDFDRISLQFPDSLMWVLQYVKE